MEQYNEPKSTTMFHEENVRSQDKEIAQRPAMRDNLPEGYFPHTDEEKHFNRVLNRKLDLVLLPSLSLLYLFNGLDRGNIGNATTQGQLIAIRLLIGLFEAGFYPSVLFYLSTFYPRFDLATRIGIFYGQYAIAGAFSGAISYGIFHLKGALHNWQYLFIIEGSLTMSVALLALVVLPKHPGSAWFLTQAEREFAAERMRVDNEKYVLKEYGPSNPDEVSRQLTMRDVIETAKDWKLWSILVCNICASVPSQAFGVFLPVVVEGMGFSAIRANLMSVPPFVCGALGLYLATFSSDHFMERGYHAISGLITCLVGLIVIITVKQNVGRYVALCILLAGSYITPSLTMAWLSGNTPAPGKRVLVIGVNGFGNLAGVIGAQLFRSHYGPTYLVPLHATLGFIAFSLVGYTAYRFTLRAVNQHRARKISSWSEVDVENERNSDKRLGDKKYTFMYSL
ncbi:hypothetical protein CDV55_107553 [Aspergillus turcosus]|uniref:Major facilitator superfamily (MFS) profile domain-containing protein n=1 Tax=Aspergillus turcosus TaxID=1245748 RepID=A0A397I2N9_9EURO|nr:hypothetical protein CDV55_107553 [Aspergillus turcosus]RLL95016.1 hypothetical protein CFD26_102775 [Aspergillus turcosus]